MKTVRMGRVLVAVAILLGLLGASFAAEARYPERPVEFIVSFPAGGPMDLISRALADAIKDYFPQPIVVVNKTGAGGAIGYSEVATAKPDGYTLGIPADTLVCVQPKFMPDVPYKGVDDWTYIIKTNIVPEIMIVGPDTPWKTMKEMLDYAKANPGKIRVGHSGKASIGHLHLLDLMHEADVELTEVPFKGAAPSVTAVMGGHVEAACIGIQPAVMGNLKAGKLRIICTWHSTRVKALPDVTTLKELGYNTMTQGSYYFVAGPKGLPKNVVDILYDAYEKAMKTDQYQKFAADSLYLLDYKGKDELRREVQDSCEFYSEAVKKWGLVD